MDISKILLDIILKYKLDEFYPGFRHMLRSEELLHGLYNLIKEKRVLCIATTIHDTNKIKWRFRDLSQIDYVTVNKSMINGDFNLGELDNYVLDSYDEVIITSIDGKECISNYLKNKRVPYYSIYDYFEKNGLYLKFEYGYFFDDKSGEKYTPEYEFHGAVSPLPFEYSYLIQEYKKEKNIDIQSILLKKSFFISLVAKNIKEARKCVAMMENAEIYKGQLDAWAEIQGLLMDIKKTLNARQKESFVVFWLDRLSYDLIEDIDYLKAKKENAVWFNNMFTTTPYTSATLRAMLCEATPADNESFNISHIDESNSSTISMLRDSGYDFFVTRSLKQVENKFWFEEEHFRYTPCSEVFWDVIRQLCIEDKNQFMVTHELLETHEPNLSFLMDDTVLESEAGLEKAGNMEVSEQLDFIDNLLPDTVTRIYMSDHGNTDFSKRFHILFAVENQKLKPRVLNSMTSIISFKKIVEGIIKKREIIEEEISLDEVTLQDIDFYNGRTIGKHLYNNWGVSPHMIGYRGIANKNIIYLKFNNGMRWMIDRTCPEKYPPSLLYDYIFRTELLPKYEKRIDLLPRPKANGDMSKYTRFMYEVINDPYISELNKKKIELVEKVLADLPEETIAIRGGGVHSKYMLCILEKVGKLNSVSYIVDNNKNCVCKVYNIPVISVEESKQEKINTLIISSFEYNDYFFEEAINNGSYKKIVDIYAEMERQGINCTNAFYIFDTGIVGERAKFPYDEVGI